MSMEKNSKGKKIPEAEKHQNKSVIEPKRHSSDGMKIAWCFDMVDKNGPFSFVPERPDFDCQNILNKLISLSSMTWADLKKGTHDKGKSKHHVLSPDKLSSEAMKRVKALNLEEEQDRIFSLALENRLRIIGVRENEKFHVIWYDPKHKFCPSNKK